MFDRFRSRNNVLSDEAIEWVVRMDGNPDANVRRAFEAWCRRSPAHAEAVRQARALLEDVGDTQAAAEHRQWVRALTPSRHRRISRRAFLIGSASAAGMAGLAALTANGVLFGPPAGLLADHSTRIGQRRQVVLPDGSRAWLNTASALSVTFSQAVRQVSVLAGEVLFEVAPDPLRPFVAKSSDGETRATSGRYALRKHADHSAITVLAGMIEARNDVGAVQVVGNQRMAFSHDVLGMAEVVDAAASTAWTRNKLIFNRQPLRAVAAELERYIASRVVVVGDRLQNLQLSGVFELDDTDALLRSVAELAKAEIVHLPLLILIR